MSAFENIVIGKSSIASLIITVILMIAIPFAFFICWRRKHRRRTNIGYLVAGAVGFIVWALAAVTWGVLVSRYYFNHVKYICPECHEVFRPEFKEAFFANHTPTARKLTCKECGHNGFCVEVWGGDGK